MAQILCLFGAWAKQCRANAGLDVYVDMRRADTHANMQPNANVSRPTLYLLTVQYALWHCHGIQINY